jgi:hypothetical protein
LPIPGRYKVAKAHPKPLLVGALNGLLPDSIKTQPKRTFTFPFESWLKRNLGSEIGTFMSTRNPHESSWLDPHAVASVWHSFQADNTNWARPWSLFVLLSWIKLNL